MTAPLISLVVVCQIDFFKSLFSICLNCFTDSKFMPFKGPAASCSIVKVNEILLFP